MLRQFAVSRRTVYRVNRFRFLAKYRLLRFAGTTFRGNKRAFLKFMFGDELHTFSYQIRNETVLARAMSGPMGLDPSAIEELFNEGRGVVRAFWARRPRSALTELTGRHLAWYVLVRTLKPKLVVESGVDRGRGSVMLLAALEANRREGTDGELVSVDPQPGAGFLVPSTACTKWRLLRCDSTTALSEGLTGQTIDMYIHDSLSVLGLEELQAVLPHTAAKFVFASSWDTRAMRAELAAVGATIIPFAEEAIHPVFPGSNVLLCLLNRSTLGAAGSALTC
jgi:hypothetical protein